MRTALVAMAALVALGCGDAVEPVSEAAAPVTGAAPTDVHDADPFRVAVISDLNGGYGSTDYGAEVHAAVDRLLTLRPDLVLSTGDMVAGQRRGVDHRAMWASFHATVSDRLAAAAIPFAVTPGNHDGSGYTAWESERELFVQEWRARTPAVQMVDDRSYPLRYSFVAGPAFFVSLDATVIGSLDDEQLAWLERQLAAAPREVVVVFGHLPLHPFTHRRENQTIGANPRLEAMLRRYGVDVFVSGHHHAYYPGQRGALRLVSTACLGAGPRRLLGDHRTSERSILLFELTDDGIASLEAYGGEAFDRRIERRTLPPAVGTGDRQIHRDDLADRLSDPSSS